MTSKGLAGFIHVLEREGELKRISVFVDPVLEIAEFADRAINSGGPALLFENNGTAFPVLINAFGSEKRMNLALKTEEPENIYSEIDKISDLLTPGSSNPLSKISDFFTLFRLRKFIPVRTCRRGRCQQVILKDPDLDILPVLKCWPHDGGRFITLPIVHTYNPFTLAPNAGMYRMQILDKCTTAMHWQLHKTGANHYRLWKETGKMMPVSVVLGGDPVYTYAATAPLPENIDEYILAGFLTQRRIKMVKCVTNDIYVPEDADIVIEGYVDPSEPLVSEGPFGDHTGFYSLSDMYPKFHVTCITHARDAVYPATVVGIPPKEDLFFTRATEKIFLKPLQMVLNSEITDLHMPPAGVAHNLVIVSMKKNYPGQGLKVINSLLGAGQMMFSKYIIAVSDGIDIRNYSEVLEEVINNTDVKKDVIFSRGPLDVLDHSCDVPAFGGKAGIDATRKLLSETLPGNKNRTDEKKITDVLNEMVKHQMISSYHILRNRSLYPVAVISVKREGKLVNIEKIVQFLNNTGAGDVLKVVLAVDEEVDTGDLNMVAWQLLGNSDPLRDHRYFGTSSILFDGTVKAFRQGGFPRPWPDIVCSDEGTITSVDEKWSVAGMGNLVNSPSLKYLKLRKGNSATVMP